MHVAQVLGVGDGAAPDGHRLPSTPIFMGEAASFHSRRCAREARGRRDLRLIIRLSWSPCVSLVAVVRLGLQEAPTALMIVSHSRDCPANPTDEARPVDSQQSFIEFHVLVYQKRHRSNQTANQR